MSEHAKEDIKPSEEIVHPTAKRSDEIQHIVERMPKRFGYWITGIVLFIVGALFFFGWTIRYHDTVSGEITINANKVPVKLIANQNGRLKLHYNSQDQIEEGDYIAHLQNSGNIGDIRKISSLLDTFDLNQLNSGFDYKKAGFPQKVSLGELNVKYHTFMNVLRQLSSFRQDSLYIHQEKTLIRLLEEYELMLTSTLEKSSISKENLRLAYKLYGRDSILHEKSVLSDAEYDRAELNYLSMQSASQNAVYDVSMVKQQIQETQNRLQEVIIQKDEREAQLKLEALSAYNDLRDQIKVWEEVYVFKAPMDGTLQFLEFWSDNQFVQAGEPVFTIVPKEEKILGQVVLPASGAGKLEKGQRVIIKLENYPYLEYGTIDGIVNSISLTTNNINTDEGEVQTYLVDVELPNELETIYGAKLGFKFEIKGIAEIVTNDRRLIQRIFDNLRYLTSN